MESLILFLCHAGVAGRDFEYLEQDCPGSGTTTPFLNAYSAIFTVLLTIL